MKEYALIVAGGKGTRFGSPLAKQFLTLHGKPVLLHTIEKFYEYAPGIGIVLVLPKDDFAIWEKIAAENRFKKPVILQEGGATRFQSVKKGLEKISGEGLVAIHDGVRPLVETETIQKSFELAAVHGSAIAAVPLKESLRMVHVEGGSSEIKSLAADRTRYRLIQTPQTFKLDVVRKAYTIPEEDTLTDDASVVERAGIPVFLFEGSYSNIKITTREDLILAEALMSAKRGV